MLVHLNHEVVELHRDSVGIESLVIQRSLPDTITLWARASSWRPASPSIPARETFREAARLVELILAGEADMRDPKPVTAEGATDFERRLLSSARAEELPREMVRQLGRALSIAAHLPSRPGERIARLQGCQEAA